MNTKSIGSAAMTAALAACIPATAHAASADATARAIIVRPLSITKTEDLDFGTLVSNTVPGTATINAATSARTVAGGTVAAGGTPQRAEFVAAGLAGVVSIVSLGLPPVLSNGAGGTMATTLTLNGPALQLLTGSGLRTIGVGGTVAVGASQAEGDYTGTFTVTVIYL